MLTRFTYILCVLMFLNLDNVSAVAKTRLLKDFESVEELKTIKVTKGELSLSKDNALKGSSSLQVTPGTYLIFRHDSKVAGDFSGFDVLSVDFNNTTGKSIQLTVMVGDEDWKKKEGGTYWNRHNGKFIVPPGEYTFQLPVTGLYRGEAGSRYNDLKHSIVPEKIIRLDFSIGKPTDGKGAIYLDNFRLESKTIPAFIHAFDFGPEQQNVEMGFKPVTWNSEYKKEIGYGLAKKTYDSGRSRDDTFPTTLYRDWVNLSEGNRHSEFKIDLPNGKYKVFTVFSDCGYWSGESARHNKRGIVAEGLLHWQESLGNKGGTWRSRYLFENIEPIIGQNLWDLYMTKLFKPVVFPVEVKDGQLNLIWQADRSWSCKVNSLIVYPVEKEKAGSNFCNEILANQRKSFLVAAAEEVVDKQSSKVIDKKDSDKGYVLFTTNYENPTYQNTYPQLSQFSKTIKITAARGEFEPMSFAIRPFKPLGQAKVVMSDLKGKQGIIKKHLAKVKVVRHLTKRGFSSINYKVEPVLLKESNRVWLQPNLTREFVIHLGVPKSAKPGDYTGSISITSDQGLKEKILVNLTVHPFTLDNTDFVAGFYGGIPDLKVAKLLRGLGFNSFSGGPRIRLSSFDKTGKPKLDFSRNDAYFKMLREAGFSQAGWGYGGNTIDHIGYTKDKGFFERYEKATKKSYKDLLTSVIREVDKHAKRNKWLPVVYGLVDETRNKEMAKDQVEQINMLNSIPNQWLKTGGSYSVSFKDGTKKDDYHQWIFDALKVSALNKHDDSVMKKAKEKKKEIYIYNQGRTRYSFGAYQWSEYRKGVKGRHEWHLHTLHGYQFFDLDGREPDTSMVYYGERGPIMTLNLLRCAEGMDDLRYCQTLYNKAIAMKKKGGDYIKRADKALSVLTDIEKKIRINENEKPAWLNNDLLRQKITEAIISLK